MMMSRWADAPEVAHVLDEIRCAGAATAVPESLAGLGHGWGMAGAWLGQVGRNGRFPARWGGLGQERPFPESLAGLGQGWGSNGRFLYVNVLT